MGGAGWIILIVLGIVLILLINGHLDTVWKSLKSGL